jgi:hypothetical protein
MNRIKEMMRALISVACNKAKPEDGQGRVEQRE